MADQKREFTAEEYREVIERLQNDYAAVGILPGQSRTLDRALAALEKAAETKPIDDLHQYGDRDLVEDSKGRWWACLGQATEEEARAFTPTPKPGAEPVPVATWQPIETAPKDGTWIMTYCPALSVASYPTVVFWDDGWVPPGNDLSEVEPTHWMPLPAPPDAGGTR